MTRALHLLVLLCFLFFPASSFALGNEKPPAYPHLSDGSTQYSIFPKPLETYTKVEGGIIETIKARGAAEPFNVAATIIFLLAILHTFATAWFTKLSHQYEHEHAEELKKRGVLDSLHPDGVPEVSFLATVLHFLGEVEAVFGLWVLGLAVAATYYHSWADFVLYVGKDRVFTEPMFVVVIMAIAASRPVLRFAEIMMSKVAALGNGTPSAWWLSVLTIAPLLGSFITEPAAMTIAALLLAKKFYRYHPPAKLAYATLGLLFVNMRIRLPQLDKYGKMSLMSGKNGFN